MARLGEISEGHHAIGIGGVGTDQDGFKNGSGTWQFQQFIGLDALKEETLARGIIHRERSALFERLFFQGFELAHGFLERVLEIIIERMFENRERNVDGFGRAKETGGANGFEANARILVLSQSLEQGQGIGNPVAPIAQDTGTGGARMGFGQAQDTLEQAGIDDIVPLMKPKRLSEMMRVSGIVWIEFVGPLLRRSDDFA